MMIVMKPTATAQEVQAVVDRVESVGARTHLIEGLPAGQRMRPHRPAGDAAVDLLRRHPLVVPVVPLDRTGLRHRMLPSQLGGAPGTLQRAGQHEVERRSGQDLRQPARILLALRFEQEVGPPGVPMLPAPGGLAVPDQPELGHRAGPGSTTCGSSHRPGSGSKFWSQFWIELLERRATAGALAERRTASERIQGAPDGRHRRRSPGSGVISRGVGVTRNCAAIEGGTQFR